MLDAIRTYIGGLFADLPKTPEIERAHAELLQMSEDKYHELRDAGVSDNEATGRVITEFGNLDDVADSLGIRHELDDAAGAPQVPVQTEAETEAALAGSRAASWLIAGGVFVILLGVSLTVLIGGIAGDAFGFDNVLDAVGVVPLLIGVAIAVGMFIVSGRRLEGINDIRSGAVRVQSHVSQQAREFRRDSDGAFTTSLVIGVGLIILSVALPVVMGALEFEAASAIGASGFLIVVGVGIGILIVPSMRRSALDAVEASGRSRTVAERTGDAQGELIGKVAAIYWPVVVVIFLAWSFIFNDWSRSWIVWPIAGVAFGAIAAAVSMFKKDGDGAAQSRASR